MLIIRQVALKDAEELLRIYAPYVKNTPVTFEYEVPSVPKFQERIRQILLKYPYLAAEENGHIYGYCYASAFKGRAAYDWSVETSIYIEEGYHGKGIGSALYTGLEESLAQQNVCNLCACITYPNPASTAFHEAFGYHMAAHFHNSGYKLGKWYDMIWMEKALIPHEIPPKPFIPWPQLSSAYRCSDRTALIERSSHDHGRQFEALP